MEYAGSYALFNYRLEDPAKGLTYSNLRLIRAFEHGLDPSSSEAGFVLVHVDMARHSGGLVSGTCDALDASAAGDRAALNAGLAGVLGALREVNAAMEGMWGRSRPREYTSFRTFIFGITSQSMFPRGVEYEGVGGGRLSFRGESGANDSMIPLADNLCQVPMPETPLTEILRDFREYRPSNHREFLAWVRDRSAGTGLRAFALAIGRQDDGSEEVAESRRLWLGVLDQVREFRWRHWCFAKEYILKRTSHPTATGGSPIVTWLPNQLRAVLDEMSAVYDSCGGAGGGLGRGCEEMMDLVGRQREMLLKEVERYCEERGV
jgi:indoleamine 2,3-dioxygenase